MWDNIKRLRFSRGLEFSRIDGGSKVIRLNWDNLCSKVSRFNWDSWRNGGNSRRPQRVVRSVPMSGDGKEQHQCHRSGGRQRGPPPARRPPARSRSLSTRRHFNRSPGIRSSSPCSFGRNPRCRSPGLLNACRSPAVLRRKPSLNPLPEPFRFRFGEIRLTFAYSVQPILFHIHEAISQSLFFICPALLPRKHIPESFSRESSSSDETGRPTSPR